MSGRQDKQTGGTEERRGDERPPDAGPGEGNSLDDAADEAVRFMERGDEPGHAGRGDAG